MPIVCGATMDRRGMRTHRCATVIVGSGTAAGVAGALVPACGGETSGRFVA
nr:hypothetical protein [Gordonia bronchialis]